MSRDITIRFLGDLTNLERTALRAGGTVESSFGRMIGIAGGLGAALGIAGLGRAVIGAGIQFQDLGNTWQAVTQGPMAAMQQKAIELGNDLSLPATSAGDAEEAMVELAKGGLQAAEAMAAAKGTLELASAANISAAEAATFESDALNTFSLRGRDATMVSDLLAAAANASSGEITDMAQSLQQAGSVFAAAHVPIRTTVTLISELAQQGIRGSDAGTSLKTMMLALQAPTSQAVAEMRALNIDLYDANGNMRDFRDIIADAQPALAKLTQAQRDAALGTIFGSDAVRAANIVFGQGVVSYDRMSAAVGRSGAAAEVAAARSRGLGGALRGLQSQAETLGLSLFQQVAPRIEAFARQASDVFPAAAAALSSGLQNVLDTIDRLSPGFERVRRLISDLDDLAKRGDWKDFGTRLGHALAVGATATAELPAAIAGLVLRSFREIDWQELGNEAAPAFEGFAIAFVATAMDPTLWVRAVQRHPLQGLVGVLSIATIIFGPEELIGTKLAAALGKVPLVGIVLEWAVRNLNRLGGPFRDLGERAGTSLLRGISDVIFKDRDAIIVSLRVLAKGAGDALEEFRVRAFVIFDDGMRNIGRAIGGGIDTLVLNPLRVLTMRADEILSYVIGRFGEIGYNAVSTFGTGMRMAFDSVAGWLAGLASRVWSVVGPTASVLWDRGYGIISGLLDGMRAAWGQVTDFVGGLADWIAAHKGPLEVDRQLLIPHGRAIMAGFHEGLLSEWARVQATVIGVGVGLGSSGRVPLAAAVARPAPGVSRTLIVNGATLQPLDERKLISLLRDYELLHG